ncbi:MAG: cell division protein FtsQ/DivIB [Rhodocyclaceae bacterium]|nr:cell division protein FtsQ/DivIB [Rhodocyclaceae bacterium]
MADRPKKPGRTEPEGFWDRPQQMLFASGVLLFAAIVGLGYALVVALLMLPVFPLRELVVVTPMQQVTATQVEYAALDSVAGNFFTVNLDRVRASFEKLPWVRRAVVRRHWPDGLEVELEEQVAVALWKQGESGEVKLVNTQGELFAAASRESLPSLAGPPGRVVDVLTRYREFSGVVAPLEKKLLGVSLSSREAWSLRLDNGAAGGLWVELGREQDKAPLNARLSRFVNAYKETEGRLKAPMAMADLRYPNGFAVRLNAKVVPVTQDGKKVKEYR